MTQDLGICEIEGCLRAAEYGLNRQVGGDKIWTNVCRAHEKEIGDENYKRAIAKEKERQKAHA